MIRTSTLFFVLICAVLPAHALVVSGSSFPETCGNQNGSAWAQASGGQGPYTFAWTGPNSFAASTDSIFGLVAGTYTVTATDNLGAMASADVTVDGLQQLPPGFGPTWAGAYSLTGYWGGACEGMCNGAGAFVEFMGYDNGPYSYNFDVPTTFLGLNTQGDPVYSGFCLNDQVNYSYTDALGCGGNGSFIVYGVDYSWYPVVTEVQGACSGGTNGSITLESSGPFAGNLSLVLDGSWVATGTSGNGTTNVVFEDLAAGTYDLSIGWSQTQCMHQQQIVVPDLGPNCGALSGTSWYDVNGDCVRDIGEVGVPNSVLAIEPGGYFALTHGDGSYAFNLPAGNYSLTQTNATLIPICPVTQPVPFAINGADVVVDLANGSTTELDLRMHASGTAARPGFAYTLFGHVSNLSPQVSGPVTVSCTYDPALLFDSANPTPSSVVGNTITWDFPAFGSFGGQAVSVLLTVPVSTPLGSFVNSTFAVTNTLTESSLANNSATVQREVTGSYDPNVKEVRTSSQESSTQYFIGTDNYLDYTIQFQNTGTDTAFTVVVTDTLDATLDMARFEQGVSSHPCTVDFLPGRVVRWTFDNILLVDSTTNEAGSHGLTSFRIRLHEPVLPGTVVTNNADIFFDFNEPIRTPDVTVVTETSTGVNTSTRNDLLVHPNPSSGTISITGLALVSVNVVDLSGREVYAVQMHPTEVVRCDLSALPAGVYAVRVRASDGVVNTVRLVMQ